MSFPKELQKAGKTQKDFEEKRKAFVNAGKASEENDIYLGLYEDLIDECKDYQELEEGYSNMARFLDQLGKESFEFQQKARQARLLGFESEGISKVRIISAECCDSCSEYDGRVIELKKALLNLPMPSSLCDATMSSEFCWSKANYQRVEDSASVSKNPPPATEFIPDPPSLEKGPKGKQSDADTSGTSRGFRDYLLPLFLLICGIAFLPFSWISCGFLVLWSLPFIPPLWNRLILKIPDLSGVWIRYSIGLLGIPLALLILLLPMLLDQRSPQNTRVALPDYEVLALQDQSNPGRSSLLVRIYAPDARSARERARVAMQAAKQIQQTELREDPRQPEYQHVSVVLEALQKKTGVSLPLAKAEYAPDGLGSTGAIKNAKQNQWTWNVSSSSIAYDPSNPPTYREFEKSLEPFQKR